jgi:peptidoglycan/LPS O-acetylase OafA/YrhL
VREQFHNLQVLRGIACLAVVAYHVAGVEAGYELYFSPLRPALWGGYAGVDLFFVLSGFIIATVSRPDLGRPAQLPRYLFRRAWRIYPTFWAAFVPAAVVYLVFAPEPLVRTDRPAELVDIVLLLPQPTVPRVIPVAWTLSYELMFYAAFAALFVLPRRAAVPLLVGWAAAVVAAAAVGADPGDRFARLPVSPFVLEFLAGALVAWCPVRLSGRAAAGLVGAAAVWVAAASAALFDPDPNWLPTTTHWRVVAFGPPAAVLVFALTGWERAGGRLRWKRLAAVGDASYSVYLLHGSLLMVGWQFTLRVGWGHLRVPHAAWLAFLLAAGVLPAMAFYRWVERPLLNLVKRKRPATVPVEPVSEPVPVRRAA